jgi:hypothetical protein
MIAEFQMREGNNDQRVEQGSLEEGGLAIPLKNC